MFYGGQWDISWAVASVNCAYMRATVVQSNDTFWFGWPSKAYRLKRKFLQICLAFIRIIFLYLYHTLDYLHIHMQVEHIAL